MKQQEIFYSTLIVLLLFFGVTGFIHTGKSSADSARQKEKQSSQESVYTIQIGSFKDNQRAEKQFRIIEQLLEGTALQALRIEKIGRFFAIRLGMFGSLAKAEQFLGEHELALKGAMVMKAYFINERIVLIHDGEEEDAPESKAGLPWDRNLPDIPQAASDLGLKLIGTVLSEEPDSSMAIIETLASGDQEVYREGETLQDVQIKKILNKRVIIDKGQGDEMLIMARETNPSTPTTESLKVQIEKREVEATIPTYSHMMRMIRLRPYSEEGRLTGLMMYNIKPESVLARMGFENGDLITAVKGEPIVVTQQAVQFYQVLSKGGEFCIDIKRDDVNQKLCLKIK